MISRLTFSAAVFAVLATATLTYAAESRGTVRHEAERATVAANPVIVMPRVEVIGRRPR